MVVPFQKGHTKLGGKKKGSVNKKTEARRHLIGNTEQALIQLGKDPTTVSPLMVMCSVMCLKLQQGEYKAAVEIAQMAAPYVHPRLNASDVNVKHSLTGRSNAEIIADIETLQAKIVAAKTLPQPPMIEAMPQPEPMPQQSEPRESPAVAVTEEDPEEVKLL
jgi:hypothetical protein